MRPLALALLVLCLSACGGSSPTNPTPPETAQTRIISLLGHLNFGNVDVGANSTSGIQILNSGNSPMTVTGIGVAGGNGSAFVASWTNGTIPAGGVQNVVVRFSPTEPRSYSGTVTVAANHTSGTNTIQTTAVGIGPLFSRSGVGDDVFDVPSYVSRVRITGTYNGNSSNFIMRIGGRGVINELLGTFWGQTSFAGNYLLEATGAATVTNSSGVSWSITEIR